MVTPEEALAAATFRYRTSSNVPLSDDWWTRQSDMMREPFLSEAQSVLAALPGYSLVPTADLDRLRAAPLDIQVLAEAMHVLGICHDNRAPGATAHGLDWAAKLAHRYGVLMDRAAAALGDRAAEEEPAPEVLCDPPTLHRYSRLGTTDVLRCDRCGYRRPG